MKLQALVRGHIERKRTAEWLQRVQALLRVQAQIRAGRAQILHSPSSTAHLRVSILNCLLHLVFPLFFFLLFLLKLKQLIDRRRMPTFVLF